MFEPRDYTPRELQIWGRFTSLTLLGLALAWVRERDGSLDDFIGFAGGRLAASWEGMGAGGIEAATLALLLNVQSLGAEVSSRAMNPEEGEIVASNLPSATLCRELEEYFEVEAEPEELLAIAGVTQEEINRLFDIFGAVPAAAGFDYQRETDQSGQQRLMLRA